MRQKQKAKVETTLEMRRIFKEASEFTSGDAGGFGRYD